MGTDRARVFVVDSDDLSAGTCEFDLATRTEEEFRDPIVRRARYPVQTPGTWDDPVRTVVPDGCGTTVNGCFAIRADDARCLIQVVVRVRLIPTPRAIGFGDPDFFATRASVRDTAPTWRQIIRNSWSRRHVLRVTDGNAPCDEYEVDVDVNFGVAAENAPPGPTCGPGLPHFEVRVWDEAPWYGAFAGGPPGDTDSGNFGLHDRDVVAHEFGHWIGYADEYPDWWDARECPDRLVSNPESIMWSQHMGRVWPSHYSVFADWLEINRCCSVEVVDGMRFRSA